MPASVVERALTQPYFQTGYSGLPSNSARPSLPGEQKYQPGQVKRNSPSRTAVTVHANEPIHRIRRQLLASQKRMSHLRVPVDGDGNS
jgi:hypothetical protein